MVSWKEERDRLLAQTLAFVKQVAAANPAPAQMSAFVPAAHDPPAVTPPITAPLAVAAPSWHPAVSDDYAPTASSSEIGSQIPSTAPISLLTPAMLRNHALYSATSERAEIMQRVAAFKARQNQIGREREAYYETVQARIRTTLGNDSSRNRL